jgi:hypothetical protein
MKSELVIVDCGKNSSTMYRNGKITDFHQNALLDVISSLPSGTKVVSEEAHLGTPRRLLSKSQPYTEEELLPFYQKCADNGIELRFCPHQSTFRARSYYRTQNNLTEEEFEKSDENDPKAIHKLLTDFPEISLSRPKKSFFDPVRESSYVIKEDINRHLNWARSVKYKSEEDGCASWIRNNIEDIVANLSDTTKNIFDLTDEARRKVGVNKGKINLNSVKMAQLYAVVATLVDYKGDYRIRENTQSPPGWKFVKRYILSMTPFHFRGGVARSNIYHHGIKTYFKKQLELHGLPEPPSKDRGIFSKDQDRLLIRCRKEWHDAIREVFQVCKKIIEKDK